MARRRSGLRGLASLGNAAGSKAVNNVRVSVARYQSAFRTAQEYAGSDPVRAIQAVGEAKKALVDAEANILAAKAARVFVPPDFVAAFKAAAGTVATLTELAQKASALAQDMKQVEPDWGNSRYGAAMPDYSFPRASDVEFGTNLEGFGGRGRRCCKRRGRR